MSPPLTDAFGTRLDPAELTAELARRLPGGFRLVADDDGALLQAPAAVLRGRDFEPALSWLRDRFAGLSVRFAAARLPDGSSRWKDARRIPVLTVSLFEGPVAKAAGDLTWTRPGEKPGQRPAVFTAKASDPRALRWLAGQLREDPEPPASGFRVLIDGLEWGVVRRPVAAVRIPGGGVVADPGRCTGCGLCTRLCPAGRLRGRGQAAADAPACLRCFECVEACPVDALRPVYGRGSAMTGAAALKRPGWLSRLRGCPGPALPAPFPPSYLLPRAKAARRPRYILGLAAMTRQEHAAVLLEDGRLVGAVEEEKLARVRHYGWPPPGEDPFGTALEECFPRRAARALLSRRGLTLDDVDLFAMNGLPARYGMSYLSAPVDQPLSTLRSGRVLYVPHHLCHAASAWRVSGQAESWVLTMDGRGERQTAAVFRTGPQGIIQVYELLSLAWRSIGGTYESLTRLLGFGPHGQGSLMALAGYGKPSIDMGRWLSWRGPDDYSVDERIAEAFADRRRPRDLAASLQAALERTILGMLRDLVPERPSGLCLAGGVALNCRLNQLIRERLRPGKMFVQPGANDAGTALGAALEAAARAGGKAQPFILEDAALGPDFTEAEIAEALEASGLRHERLRDAPAKAARLLADGEVVCWFQGRLEFGPRALGRRSILADPRSAKMKDKVNRLKQRQPWRPFGPSVLAGRETDWFSDPFDSRFMLFTVPVRPEMRGRIPAVMHVDGTTRPQSVHRRRDPLYHRLISEFERLTGVPMVLNTSFNRKGEPIVCTPQDALESFRALGADALVIGPFLVRNKPRPTERISKRMKGGRRLLLRLTTECDCACAHCTMQDLAGKPGRSFAEAAAALLDGRAAGCDELVLMRGEPALWPGLPELAAAARGLGYRFIQVQTSGRAFCRPGLREGLLAAVDAAEVTVLGPDPETHDAASGVPGSFRETLMGIKALLGAGKEVLATVPVLRRNLSGLDATCVVLSRLGVRRVQFNFPRPVQLSRTVATEPLARLADASAAVRRAARAAAGLGLSVSTEGLPLCHLDAGLRRGAESAADWDRFRVDDLGRVQDGFGSQIRQARPEPPVCRGCRARRRCPRTWGLYLEMFGSAELRPF
ncbi:MAG: 4Fe-4S dicluster domain-containing protein [Elusimicrobia bacterium]|nr:4Fe-4S dicluster domain-containing protein [Elusimicrobiota bacterium]